MRSGRPTFFGGPRRCVPLVASRRLPRTAGLFLALLLVAPFLPPTPGRAQPAAERKIILRIEIRGLKRTPEAELLARLSSKIRIGEIYDPQAVIEETGRLYALGHFRRVEDPIVTDYEDGVAITFVVEEKPTVVRVRFVGRDALSQNEIVRAAPPLLTREDDLYNAYWVQQDEETIRGKYVRSGYLFAQVRAEVEESDAEVTVTFRLQEGTRVRVRSIEFVGNRSIPSSELRGILNTREKDFWFFGLWNSGFYDYEILEADLQNLHNYYRQSGFFDVHVEADDIRLDSSKEKLHIRIRIREGPVYIFQGYRFSGNAVFSDQTLRKLTTAPVGKRFSTEALERDRQEINRYYGDRAYIDIRVLHNLEYSYDTTEVHVRLNIREGNEIYIEHVRVEGNLKTQDRVIRRELEFYPGEKIDHSKLLKSRSNLSRLRLFREIDYSYDEGSSPSNRDVVVTVEEDTSGQLIVGFGVTSGFGVIGNLSITKRNFDITDLPESIYDIPDSFTGAGQTLNLQAQPGTRRSLYRLRFVEPYIFDTRNSLDISLSSLDLLREDWDESRATIGPRIGHSFDFDRDFRVSLGSRVENVEVRDIEPGAPGDVFASAGHSSVLTVNTLMSYNKVLFEPLEGPFDGHDESIFYEYAGGFFGGDVNFHKIEVSNSFYFPVYVHEEQNLHHVISLSNRIGLIEPHNSDDFIPVFERYFLGGPQTVRGFRFRGLGPHENGSPFGGTAQLYGNLEYSFPIFGKVLRGVIFLDYGNLSTDLNSFDLGETRITLGAGARITFPFLGQPLPIGLFFGVPLHKEDGDRTRLFLFAIGTPF
ncbi:MAG: outer membrane protein assembly factor BamA [Planctomycetota bacterium]|nr:outer membrane protein assembly factor BamA [Planctomycetota bacterium]